ncbi:hypothetical protein BDF21DRAFT_164814 [Thamnidium elegans]|nr:hypothetical protein BDF21DRAFT_164814 [Thamnidium elegans]
MSEVLVQFENCKSSGRSPFTFGISTLFFSTWLSTALWLIRYLTFSSICFLCFRIKYNGFKGLVVVCRIHFVLFIYLRKKMR